MSKSQSSLKCRAFGIVRIIPLLLVATYSVSLVGQEDLSSSPDFKQIWWEAEQASRGNFPAPRREEGSGDFTLSEGLWIGIDAGWEETPYLEYDIEVERGGAYGFFVRKFWKHGPFRWRFNDQPWQYVGRDIALLDAEFIRVHWGPQWVKAGNIALDAGTHTLRIEVTANDAGPAFFDCFLLTAKPFYPLGRHKPWEALPKPAEGWVTFNQYDTLFDPSPIDLRFLNEHFAGDNGFIGGYWAKIGARVGILGSVACGVGPCHLRGGGPCPWSGTCGRRSGIV